MEINESEIEGLYQSIDQAKLPEEARLEAERELDRLKKIPISSSEYNIVRNHLDWLAALPWNHLSNTAIDIQYARKILDEDHYDLDKAKDRIIEYLAVKKLREERTTYEALAPDPTTNQVHNPSAQSSVAYPQPNIKFETSTDLRAREPILCFLGPPGVGKTSLGQSIARALGRKFVRIALGGVHDETEIRGNRRSDLGALPGRIIQSIKRAEVKNPVFMLDEIDKITTDIKGDPTSALLEVLDPSQNAHFVDHYLGVGFDLSEVLFIATANNIDDIPSPLLDRMEIIKLAGYIEEDKIQIAERYLIPKQRVSHGLQEREIHFEKEAIRHIIRGYAREAGVRTLDRKIAKVCRKVALMVVQGHKETIQITPANVKKLLGNVIYFDEIAERTSRPGIATGLAWTSSGGDLLFIEATLMHSNSERLILTGMMGDVMRESAQAALSYVRSNAENLGLDPEFFDSKAIHIHIPEGAIPKDGPSAGITMATALVSVITGRVVHSNVAMTGEITLRGQVLSVGGVKEKVLAAHRAGINTIILPKHNEHDLEEIPEELRKALTFIFVDTIETVFENALEHPPPPQYSKSSLAYC